MGIREDVLALADDVESTIGGCYGCLLDKRGLCKAESDFDCNDEVCKFVAHRLRAIAEKDAENVTTVSAYDLLPDEDRKAIAWVREHGGLETVEKRLMPDGMEWPTVDGKPVDFVTGYEPSLGVLEAVSIYNNGACEVMSHDGIVENATEIHVLKPKVLDADGVEIRAGDTVWHVETGEQCRVVEVDSRSVSVDFRVDGDGTKHTGSILPANLTHRAPVLAADGKPLREGEKVYSVSLGEGPFTVREIKSDDDPDEPEHLVWCGETWGESLNYAKKWRIPDQLTHEQPDTWERIEEDKGLNPFDYCKKVGHKLWTFDNAEEFKSSDLVRRCRALAERGA